MYRPHAQLTCHQIEKLFDTFSFVSNPQFLLRFSREIRFVSPERDKIAESKYTTNQLRMFFKIKDGSGHKNVNTCVSMVKLSFQ